MLYFLNFRMKFSAGVMFIVLSLILFVKGHKLPFKTDFKLDSEISSSEIRKTILGEMLGQESTNFVPPKSFFKFIETMDSLAQPNDKQNKNKLCHYYPTYYMCREINVPTHLKDNRKSGIKQTHKHKITTLRDSRIKKHRKYFLIYKQLKA